VPVQRSIEDAAARVWAALADVPDPEIPVVSVIDLGMIRGVRVEAPTTSTTGRSVPGGSIHVELLPTFVGCPAVQLIRAAIGERLAQLADRVEVEVSFAEPWTSDRITPAGRAKLRASGFAPPGPAPGEAPLFETITTRPVARCPYCGSEATNQENAFGPTPCRSLWWCTSCRQPFERFKNV
jgi:ring-1,2-phenylacetyl-CoA epoxidase subunit PaaD